MKPAFLRLLLSRSFWLAFLLLILIVSFTFGLSEGIRGGVTWLITPIAVVGAMTSYGLAHSRVKAWQAGALLAVLGITGIIFQIARIAEPFVEFLKSLFILHMQTITWIRGRIVPPDLTQIVEASTNLGSRLATLLVRTWFWVGGLRHGPFMNDPVARAFSWSLVVFFLTVWAGWILGRYRNPLLAFIPAIAVLAIVSDYTGTGFLTLWIMLIGILLSMGLAHYDIERVRWQRTGVDFSESISLDTGSAIVIVSVMLAALAWLMPSFSVKAMVDTLREWGKDKNNLAESFGLRPPPPPPTHFSTYISPQTLPRSHLLGSGPELSKHIVMTVRTGELSPRPPIPNPPPVPRHYWREVTYDRYIGTGWLSNPVVEDSYEANEPLLKMGTTGYRIVEQEVTNHEDLGGRLHWTGSLITVNLPSEVAWRSRPDKPSALDPLGGADMLGAISPGASYRATSIEPIVDEKKLRAAGSNYPAGIDRYLQLPDSTPERVLALARDLTASEPTPFDRALAIETYLRKTYPYTLDVPRPPLGVDVADYFLFDLKKGYCDYYATAMVVLARAAGLPARFVSGYASGTYDSETAQYLVTEANAHSWAEIFFPGIGWVEFEPTAGLPGIDRSVQPAVHTPPNSTDEANQENVSTLFLDAVKSSLGKFAMGLGIIIAIAWAALWIESLLLARMPVNKGLTIIYRRMERLGGKVTGPGEAETPYEFSSRLISRLDSISHHGWQSSLLRPAATAVELITQDYVSSTFSAHILPRASMSKAIRIWRGLRVRLLLADFHRILINRKIRRP